MTDTEARIGEALAWLDGHVNLETHGAPPGSSSRAPSLERITALTELLGSPQLEYPAIHITGTNGKTSVARLTSELLVASGLSVGTYTSPHLERVNERLAWNTEPISDPDLAGLLDLLAEIEPHTGERASYFELLTAAALRWFADEAVDVAVVEVGMAGTWDATNLVRGDVAVVTNVSVDHVEFLGSDRRGIAAEKAGIVKEGSTLVLGETDPALADVFEATPRIRTARRDVDFGVTENALAHGGRLVSLFTPGGTYDDVFLSLHGAHQADNAAVALTAAEEFLGRALDDDLVREVVGSARSPGRLEPLAHQPLVLLDGAHNVAGALALRSALAGEFADAQRTFVVGLLREKDPAEMLDALGVAEASHVVVCRPPSPRALDPDVVAEAARELGVEDVVAVDDVAEALEVAREVTPDDGQIVVTGSLYTVGLARALLRSAP